LNLLALLALASFDVVSIADTRDALNALGPHPFGSPRNQAAAQFVAAKLKDAGLSQTAVDEFAAEGGAGANVVANLPGRTDRLLVIAAHHDTLRDGRDLAARSRSLAVLVDFGRQAARLRPAKTWILASFDGGASHGEGIARYLETLGTSRSLVDGVFVIDASAGAPAVDPVISVPACPAQPEGRRRGIASRDLVDAALHGLPASTEFSFDDPGISLFTQPFIRMFRTRCDETVARALETQLGVVRISDTAYSRAFLSSTASEPPPEAGARDTAAVRLGETALAVIQSADAVTLGTPRSDSWLVVGRGVWPGWLLFAIGSLSLAPSLWALRSQTANLAFRAAGSLLFAIGLFHEPEIALFIGLLPNLLPAALPRPVFIASLTPLFLLVAAGGLAFARGQVIGSWLSVWFWLGIAIWIVLLFVSLRQPARKSAAKSKRARK
jgi:hypothetical protein